MKKILSLALALVLLLSLCACSGTTTTKLTLDNYKTYLKFSSGAYATQVKGSSTAGYEYKYGLKVGDTVIKFFNNGFGLSAKTEGASTNFNYNNVSVTVRFTGTYGVLDADNRSWVNYDIDKTYTFSCDISGAGSSYEIISVEGKEPEGQTHTDLLNIRCEIVSISGTVTSAG